MLEFLGFLDFFWFFLSFCLCLMFIEFIDNHNDNLSYFDFTLLAFFLFSFLLGLICLLDTGFNFL
jgi:hypothetical protein